MRTNIIVNPEKKSPQSLKFVEKDHDPSVRTRATTYWIIIMIFLALVAIVTWYNNFNPGLQIWFRLFQAEVFVKYLAQLEIWHWASIFSVIATAWSVSRTHKQDGEKNGGGIRDVVDKIDKNSRYNLKSEVVSATMTKQSVLAAIASILIVIIGEVSDSSPYDSLILFLSRIGYLISILLILVSVKAYDYATRFCWEKHNLYQKAYKTRNSKGKMVQRRGNYKAQLLNKALDLDIKSYYCLLFFFVLSMGLISWVLPILGSFYMGVLLLKYYFFDFNGVEIIAEPACTGEEVPKNDGEDSESGSDKTQPSITPAPTRQGLPG